jgi:DNA-binding NarL/FixJ family response regulator
MRGEKSRSAVILDSHPLWLDAMDKLVVGVGIVVVGRATDIDEAVAMVDEFAPDIFIAGINASDADQIALVRMAQQSNPELKCVVLADNTEPEAIEAAFTAGASVYCVKTAEQADLASAIRQAFDPSIYTARSGVNDAAPRPRETQLDAHGLTRRELEILRLVAEGHSNSQLAQMLWVTEQTVKFHLSNVYRKLGVANRTEASRWAQLNGLLPSQRGPDESGHEGSSPVTSSAAA